MFASTDKDDKIKKKEDNLKTANKTNDVQLNEKKTVVSPPSEYGIIAEFSP